MALSPDGRTLAASYPEGKVSLWDVVTGKLIKDVMDFKHTRSVYSMVFSPKDGTMLLTGSPDRTVGIHEVPSGVRINRFSGHTDWVRCAAWSPDAQYVASGSDDGTVHIWKIRGSDDQEPEVLQNSGDDSYVLDIAFSPNGKYIVSCGNDGKFRIWEQESPGAAVAAAAKNSASRAGWQLKQSVEVHERGVCRVAISLDSKRVVSLGADDMLKVWDIETGKLSDRYPATEFEGTDRWLRLWFDHRSADHVMSAYGAQSLTAGSSSSAFSRAPRWCPYRIVVDRTGRHVTRDGKKLMLCPSVVGVKNSLLAGEDSVVFGMRDGGILVYRFAQDVVTRADYIHDVVAV
jgi:WD40 repeat protein